MEVLLNALEDAQNAFGNKRAAYKGFFFLYLSSPHAQGGAIGRSLPVCSNFDLLISPKL